QGESRVGHVHRLDHQRRDPPQHRVSDQTSCGERPLGSREPGTADRVRRGAEGRVAMTHTGVATVQSRNVAAPNRTRREHDSLGSWDVPTQAYYGVHTARALQNFPISGTAVSTYPDFVNALAAVKQAAAAANRELGLLDSERAEAIEAACVDI